MHWSKWKAFGAVLGSLVFVAGIIVTLVLTGVATTNSTAAPKVIPISQLLALSQQHGLKSVTITGNTVDAVSTTGARFEASKEPNDSLERILQNNGAQVTIDNSQGNSSMSILFNIMIFVLIGGFVIFLIRRGSSSGVSARSMVTTKSRVAESKVPSCTFDDVAGADEAKLELQEIVEYLKHPKRFTKIGARVPRGVLLSGPPGTGKTLVCKAVAGEAGVPFFNISGSEFVEMYVGVGASRVRNLFKEAKKAAPSIIFVDEVDAVGRHRSSGQTSGSNEEREQTLNQLLVEMDGFDSNTNVIVMAATNRPDMLDQALLRPGRFDRQVTLDAPDVGGRHAILNVHSKGKPLGAEVDLLDVARQTTGFSGADLANVLNEGALLSARRGKDAIGGLELEEAVLRVMAGPERKSRVMSLLEKDIVAYHEVGHAIVMKSVPNSDPVRKVSCIARGMALGITVQMPKEDRYLMRRSELEARMAGAMGGRAAEEIIFGDVTTGAQQDFEYATNIARRMVCEFGMSPLGNVAFKKRDQQGNEAISEEIARKIDHEVMSLVDNAYDTALTVLRAREAKLRHISEYLKVVENIDGAELDDLLAGKQPTVHAVLEARFADIDEAEEIAAFSSLPPDVIADIPTL